MNAARALLTGIVDYAGVFPPAGLDMRNAARNYATYRDDDAAWMLGRFVAPAARLDEMLAVWQAAGFPAPAARVSAVLGADALSDLERVQRFNDANAAHILVDAVEGKLADSVAIADAAARVGPALQLFVEIAAEPDPAPQIAGIAKSGVNAEIRAGGVTPEAFPTPRAIVRFMRRCIDAGVPFKATAGLHHPLTAEYRLTYDAGAACGSMFGFLNVFLAAAFLSAGMSDADAERILDDKRKNAFALSDDTATWEGNVLTAAELHRVRERVAVSFGSCSFREPVDELASLGIVG